jgi:hypothetical protein
MARARLQRVVASTTCTRERKSGAGSLSGAGYLPARDTHRESSTLRARGPATGAWRSSSRSVPRTIPARRVQVADGSGLSGESSREAADGTGGYAGSGVEDEMGRAAVGPAVETRVGGHAALAAPTACCPGGCRQGAARSPGERCACNQEFPFGARRPQARPRVTGPIDGIRAGTIRRRREAGAGL